MTKQEFYNTVLKWWSKDKLQYSVLHRNYFSNWVGDLPDMNHLLEFTFRRTPEPKLRPRRPEEVPVGCPIRNKGTGSTSKLPRGRRFLTVEEAKFKVIGKEVV